MKDKELYEMLNEENRLKSFKKWPFGSDTCMSKEKMAEAGFFFTGSKKEPDLAKCYICLKELDGWEEEDDPWEEHKKHAPYCQFIQLNKKPCELTVQDTHELEMHRNMNVGKKVLSKMIVEFQKQAEKTRSVMEGLV
ncbi:baculoviral IAP repeat-containing protein 5.2-like [Macrobrachium nipponense]|uniref:baculoviral IAP repeat-containing protein 5.2-like n=1 Tax=Macrobrachium nipponense TaxID=159736 RepID=UPI0030C8BB5F